MASFSTYQSKLRDGLPTKDDARWVEELLDKFQNRQTALFMRWLNIKLPTKKENRERLVIITPLRIILIKTKAFGRSVHRKYRIIDIISVTVDDTHNKYTECIISHCDLPPQLSLSRSREKLKNNESGYDKLCIKIFLPKDIDREFLDILQWSLFIVTRGLPNKFKPKINIPQTFKNDISDPVGPGQFIIDRYVAYCDAQSKNSGAGIAASEELIEYTLGSVKSGIFDIHLSFGGNERNNKKIDALQFVCLSQGLSFSKVYHKLIVSQLSSLDDTSMAILMTLFETNYAIKILEFRRVDLQTKTMRSLSSSLSCTNGLSSLQELNIIDISMNKNIVLAMSAGLTYIKLKVLRLTNCYLNKTGTIQLFNILQKTEQYKHLTHLNLSKNQCGRQGTKAIAAFLNKCCKLQVLVVADAQLDGNEFFHALTIHTAQKDANQLSHINTLTLLDFSGNNIGEKGANYLGKFIRKTTCLNYCKLSRCNMSVTQLTNIFGAAMDNMQGFPDGKFNKNKKQNKQNIYAAPTHCDIMLCTNLLCLSLDLSDNQFGSKGADILCHSLQKQSNYTIVSLNLAKNNFNVSDMKNIIYNLKSLACLERLCISENVRRGIAKKTDKDGLIGKALLYLFQQTPTLNELAITGNESNNCYLDIGLQHFLAQINKISNLEFLDITGNKIGDKQFVPFIKALKNNSTLRLVRCNDNKLSSDVLLNYLELLSNHPTVIDKIPNQLKSSKSNKKYNSLRDAARQNLKGNKQQFEIDRKMITALPREMRLEKELRRPCGTQYGITIERIRGTVQYPDYAARIPQVLVKLKNLLDARGGFQTVGIFRIQPDAKEFPVVRQALNTNNFEFRINDINCIANALKVWFRELPIKVLTPISKQRIMQCSSQKQVADIITNLLQPHKSIFEWLLDLAVQVVHNCNKNKMDAKNMAVVLCPNLYDNNEQTADALSLQQALLTFTEFAIRHRIEFRKNNPVQKINDMFALKAGLTPGIADQNALAMQMLANEDEDEDEDEDEFVDESKENNMDALSGEEGDAFAGAIYSGSRFRGASQASDDNKKKKIGKLNVNKYIGHVDDNKEMIEEDIPPPAFSDYEDDEQHFADIAPNAGHKVKNMSIAIADGKVKNVAATLAIDPTAMRPGNKGPPKRKNKAAVNNEPRAMDASANLARPAPPNSKKKKKKKKKKKLLLESMVDNYPAASAAAKVPESETEPEPIRRQSHHVPMESKVLGGFVQPGLAMLHHYDHGANPEQKERTEKKSKKHKRMKADSDSDDELIPALAHLDGDGIAGEDGDGGGIGGAVIDYVYEEKQFEFETKPMGFQIEAENGKISVRSVRQMSVAGKYGVEAKWDIVAVNGFRDWSSMLGILESSLGPFAIIFAVPVSVAAMPANNSNSNLISLEKSLSNTSNQHPIPPIINNNSLPAPPEQKEVDIVAPYVPPPAQQKAQAMIATQESVISISGARDDEMKEDEYNRNKANFDMMGRNSSAIAKQILNEHDDEENNKMIIADRNVYNSSGSMQQNEYKRLEFAIKKLQNKNAQLLETLQVIRLKGEMERIELDNAKNIQNENNKLKKELNDKIKPLKAHLKNANKQIQTQRQLMYQYANLLRRHKIPIPELQVSLQENESSSESDSDSDSDSDDSSQD